MSSSSSSVSSSSSSSSAVQTCHVDLHVGAVQISEEGYAITVTVMDAVCLPRELLVIQRKPTAGTGFRDVFSNVASPADLEEYPVGEPVVDYPFYRVAQATLVFRDLGLLMSCLADLKRDICQLVETINQMEQLDECQIVIDKDGVTPCLPIPEPEPPVPPVPPVPSSSSSLSSSSSSPSLSSSSEEPGVLVWDGGVAWDSGAVWS